METITLVVTLLFLIIGLNYFYTLPLRLRYESEFVNLMLKNNDYFSSSGFKEELIASANASRRSFDYLKDSTLALRSSIRFILKSNGSATALAEQLKSLENELSETDERIDSAYNIIILISQSNSIIPYKIIETISIWICFCIFLMLNFKPFDLSQIKEISHEMTRISHYSCAIPSK